MEQPIYLVVSRGRLFKIHACTFNKEEAERVYDETLDASTNIFLELIQLPLGFCDVSGHALFDQTKYHNISLKHPYNPL